MTTFLLLSVQWLTLSVGVKAELIRMENRKKASSTSEKQSSENDARRTEDLAHRENQIVGQ